MKLVVSRRALADLERLHQFLAEREPGAARRAAASLNAAIQSLTELPNRGRPSGIPRIRELVVPFGHSTYVLRYTYDAQSARVVVLRIWHSRELR